MRDTMLIEEGRLCVKKFGRDAGQRAVVIKSIDKNFVSIITHSRLRERRCNIRHLEFLAEKINPADKDALTSALELDKRQAEKLSKS